MVDEDVRERAKAEIRLRLWASKRGKGTRAFIREHPGLAEEYDLTGQVQFLGLRLPPYVTEASVLQELRLRLRAKELRRSAREWRDQHPAETERIREEILD